MWLKWQKVHHDDSLQLRERKVSRVLDTKSQTPSALQGDTSVPKAWKMWSLHRKKAQHQSEKKERKIEV